MPLNLRVNAERVKTATEGQKATLTNAINIEKIMKAYAPTIQQMEATARLLDFVQGLYKELVGDLQKDGLLETELVPDPNLEHKETETKQPIKLAVVPETENAPS